MRSAPQNPNCSRPAFAVRAAVIAVLFTAFTAGCVYRIDIQQGNFLDVKAVDQVATGMTRSQVRYLLGTPLVSAVFDKERWDYVYYFKRGRLKQPEQRQLTVYFEGDTVSRIDKPAKPVENKEKVATTGGDTKPAETR